MEIKILKTDRRVVFTLLGTLCETGAAARFAETVSSAFGDADHFIIDLSEAALPDSRLMGKLVMLLQNASRTGKRLQIYLGENNEARELFRITHLDAVFPFLSCLP